MSAARLLNLRLALAIAVISIASMLAFAISRETPVGSLKGKIVAQDTGNPLPALIYLTLVSGKADVGARFETESAKDGSFSFLRLPAGGYSVQVCSKARSMEPVHITIEEGKTKAIEVELAPPAPDLDLYVHQHIFTPDERPRVTCKGFVESDALAVRLYNVDLDAFLLKSSGDLQRLLGIRSYYGDSAMKPPVNLDENPSLILVESLLAPIDTRDLEGVFTQRVALPKLGPGLYVVAVKGDNIQKLGWVMVTSLGLITKTAGQEMLAYTVDLKRGAPIAAANISAYVESNVVTSGKTDDGGILSLALPSKAKGSSQPTIIARKGESFAFVSAWFSSTEQSGRLIYAYTDRPVYRPGQRVYFRGIVRQTAGGRYAVPGSMPITVEVRDSRDTLIYRAVKHTNRFGCYSGNFTLNPEAAAGYYSLVSSIKGQYPGRATDFQVASYRKPEFSVRISFPRKRYVRGDMIRARISASYYFGAPLANARVSYLIRRSPYWPFETDEEEGFEEGYEGYEDYGGYGEIVNEVVVHTNSNGEAVIEFPADWKQPEEDDAWDADQEFSVEAYVVDKGGRGASATGSVIATRGEFAIDVIPSRRIVTPGAPVTVSILAMDYDKRPVKKQSVAVLVGRERWRNGESRFEQFQKKRLTTDDSGRASMRFSARRSGGMRVIAKSRDKRGNNIVASTYVWSYAAAYEEDIRYPDLQIVTDKKTYDPGDTAKILINTKSPGATALVTVEGTRVYNRITVHLKNRTTMVQIPVMSEYKPNFYIGVCFVRNKSFVNQQARAKVSLRAQSLRIKIEPNKLKYRPGEDATYRIKVTDSSGRPASAELSIGVVDEAIYAIAEDHTKPILDYFYVRKPNQVDTKFSFPQIYLSDSDKAGRVLARSTPLNIRIRKRFLDTAFWNPSVLTDSNGEAAVSFQLPDNLTTWRTTVRGVTIDTSCGEARNTVVAGQDFLVRLEVPRFLVQSDNSTVTAVVHNYTGRNQRANVDLKAPGLSVQGKARRRVLVRDGGSERLDWQIYAPRPGSFEITVRAAGETAGDAMQLALPVYPHGAERQTVRTGAMSGSTAVKLNVQVRRDSISGTTCLRVRLAPSLAAAMLGSLDYLAQYPYGCTEQTISSFLPDVFLSRSFRELGMRNAKLEAELPDMVTKGLFRLYRFQLDDGGWSWCEYGESDPWMTAYVCYGLVQAREAGFPVNIAVLRSGLERLSEHMRTENLDIDEKAFGCYVLTLGGLRVDNQLKRIASMRVLSPETLALLTLSFTHEGKIEEGKAVLRRLFECAAVEPGMIHWGSPEGFDGGDIEATALSLQAVLKIDPNDPRALEIVRWLMRQRQVDAWYSTRDTAMVLYAVSEFLKVSKELNPDFDAKVLVNGKVAAAVHFDRNSVFLPEFEVELTSRDLLKGRNSLEIRKAGVGNLYYSTKLTQYVARDYMPSTVTGAGLSITRQYFNPPSRFYEQSADQRIGSPVEGCRAGDVILVRLIVTANARVRHLLVEDFIPAGCEIADRGHVSSWEWDNWWIGQDVRDEKISFYVDELWRGQHVIEYQMRAGFSGIYHALPAQVFAMYEPKVRASTEETEFAIR